MYSLIYTYIFHINNYISNLIHFDFDFKINDCPPFFFTFIFIRLSCYSCLKLLQLVKNRKRNHLRLARFGFTSKYSWVPNKRVYSIIILALFPPYSIIIFTLFLPYPQLANFPSSFFPLPTRLLGPTCLRILHKISTQLVYLALLV